MTPKADIRHYSGLSLRAILHRSLRSQVGWFFDLLNLVIFCTVRQRRFEMNVHLFDRASERIGRLIIVANGRASIQTDIEGLIRRIAPWNRLCDASFAHLLVVDEHRHHAALADAAAVILELDAY